jgi:hypothetical protein
MLFHTIPGMKLCMSQIAQLTSVLNPVKHLATYHPQWWSRHDCSSNQHHGKTLAEAANLALSLQDRADTLAPDGDL